MNDRVQKIGDLDLMEISHRIDSLGFDLILFLPDFIFAISGSLNSYKYGLISCNNIPCFIFSIKLNITQLLSLNTVVQQIKKYILKKLVMYNK